MNGNLQAIFERFRNVNETDLKDIQIEFIKILDKEKNSEIPIEVFLVLFDQENFQTYYQENNPKLLASISFLSNFLENNKENQKLPLIWEKAALRISEVIEKNHLFDSSSFILLLLKESLEETKSVKSPTFFKALQKSLHDRTFSSEDFSKAGVKPDILFIQILNGIIASKKNLEIIPEVKENIQKVPPDYSDLVFKLLVLLDNFSLAKEIYPPNFYNKENLSPFFNHFKDSEILRYVTKTVS